MASRRETRSGLGAPGSTGAEQTRDPLGAPGTTGAAPTSAGFNPAAQGQGQQHRPSERTGYDLGGQGHGQQHRPSGYDQTGYDLGSQGHGQQHRPSGYDQTGYDLGGQGYGQQHHAPRYDPSGYDLGRQGQGQGQQHHSSGGGGNLTGSGMEQHSGRETIQITTTTGAFDMPTTGYGVATGLPTTTATGGYGDGLDAGDTGTTDLGIGDIAGSEERRNDYTKDRSGTRDQRK